MVSLRLFLLVVSTLVCRECSSSEPRIDFSQSALAVIGLSMGFGLLFKFSTIVVVRHWQAEDVWNARSGVLKQFGSCRKLIEVTWVAMLPITLLFTGWVPWTKTLTDAGWPQTLALLLLFLPSLLFIVLVELTAAQFEEILGEASKSVDGSALPGWPQLWRLRIRLGEFANLLMCLMPVLLISISNDVFKLAIAGLSQSMGVSDPSAVLSEGAVAGLSTLSALLLILMAYPTWIGLWMGVRDIPTELGTRIEGYRRQIGVGPLAVRLMQSDNRWNGAAVVGWFPYFRKLWLGDGLIQQLNERELDMVIFHELAHIRKLHFLWRCLPIVSACGLACISLLLVEAMLGQAELSWVGKFVSLSVGAGVLLTGLGSVSRSCELEADRVACQLAEAACPWAGENPGAAAAALASSLTKLLSGSQEVAGRTWLHPSLRERLANLASGIDSRLRGRKANVLRG